MSSTLVSQVSPKKL